MIQTTAKAQNFRRTSETFFRLFPANGCQTLAVQQAHGRIPVASRCYSQRSTRFTTSRVHSADCYASGSRGACGNRAGAARGRPGRAWREAHVSIPHRALWPSLGRTAATLVAAPTPPSLRPLISASSRPWFRIKASWSWCRRAGRLLRCFCSPHLMPLGGGSGRTHRMSLDGRKMKLQPRGPRPISSLVSSANWLQRLARSGLGWPLVARWIDPQQDPTVEGCWLIWCEVPWVSGAKL